MLVARPSSNLNIFLLHQIPVLRKSISFLSPSFPASSFSPPDRLTRYPNTQEHVTKMSCPSAFGAAVEPEPSLGLTPQQKELIRCHPLVSRTTLEALDESKHPFEDEKISCQICHNPYLIPAAVDEESERPFMTACGHIFGQNCFRE
jgi:hypothetical protein